VGEFIPLTTPRRERDTAIAATEIYLHFSWSVRLLVDLLANWSTCWPTKTFGVWVGTYKVQELSSFASSR